MLLSKAFVQNLAYRDFQDQHGERREVENDRVHPTMRSGRLSLGVMSGGEATAPKPASVGVEDFLIGSCYRNPDAVAKPNYWRCVHDHEQVA
jgi:hypothetical protein